MAKVRSSGLDFVGNINWGTHMCQFFKSQQDLLDVVVPYFVDGLKNNELCVWVTSEFLTAQTANKAMQQAIPNYQDYVTKGQIEIIPYTDWYLKEGKFELQRVLHAWVEKHNKAIVAGYAGLRATGNPFWLSNKKDWKDFTAYETEINKVISNYKMLVLCTYSIDKCQADEIIDVVTNHEFSMIKREGKWTLIQSIVQKKTADALIKTEKKFRELYSSMTEGVAFHEIISDAQNMPADYRIVDVNPSFEKITGLCKEDAVGKIASELYGTETPLYLDVYAKVAATGKPRTFETYFPPMDRYFSISCISTATGKFTTVFHDITERKKAEEALNQAKTDWERTFDSVPDLIAILDNNHHIVRANKAMTNALKLPAEKCIGLNCYDHVHGTSCPPDFCPHSKTIQDGEEHIAEVHEERLGGDFLVSTTPLFDEQGFMVGSVHVARNITERKKAEKDMAKIQIQLKENASQLEEYANKMEQLAEQRAHQLKASERMAAIGQTASMVGHDIRNPLQAIIGDVYLVKEELQDLSESESKQVIRESITAIEENIFYINKIVSDLQDYTRPLKPVVEEINVKQLIQNILSMIKIPKNIQTNLQVENKLTLNSDPAYLKRALTNLIINAIQAMPNGGELTIKAQSKGNITKINIKDTGVGISKEAKDKLFMPLFTTKAKGQGLGLAVVKRLAEGLGGKVSFESEEGSGTEFTVEFLNLT
ncbi:MAG: MEDS domain-containing protein [Candidatus Bathyarchaeota archaeon]|nr:MEDS domain-containing protein [Candidatus Bathyarchaeota archaeon]